jgi:dephospho-CoA kinase
MSNSEFEKFDATVRKVLSVSHDELKRRERAWKRNKTKRKKRALAKASREGHASGRGD